ncbi:MAG: nucleotidyl transferase AbiEii/AbiGii toxin family protein [Bryobacterales bacterium]|nr:nucleotidyl transferase AbiEii/AbiGii toxin family protein [Bryobacterales bacterium]
MSPPRETRDAAASVRRRLLNLAREREVDYNLVLQRYAAERFLYRLAVSGEVDRFTLKGATLFRVWTGQELRPTRDVDFLAAGPEDPAALRTALAAVCGIPCPEDGVVFDPASIRIDDIRDEQPYGGLRARIKGSLGRARLALQVDVGFGDVITPEREERDYPTLLDLPAPRLWTYPRETLIAEKLEAMVHLGAVNSRVKDLWDIACLARRFVFDGETLRTTVAETFRRRGTAFAGERPAALLPAYYEDAPRARRWRELRRQIGTETDGPARLVDAGEELRRFLGPVCDSIIEDSPFTQAWPAGGPWRTGIQARTGDEGS